jgi:hypothetical protein
MVGDWKGDLPSRLHCASQLLEGAELYNASVGNEIMAAQCAAGIKAIAEAKAALRRDKSLIDRIEDAIAPIMEENCSIGTQEKHDKVRRLVAEAAAIAVAA